MGGALSDDTCCGLDGRDEGDGVDLYFVDEHHLTKRVEMEFTKLFTTHDLDNSGQLDASECENLYQDLVKKGFVFSASNVKELIKQADSNKDGKISMREFKDWIRAEVAKRHSNLLSILDGQNWLQTEPTFKVHEGCKSSGAEINVKLQISVSEAKDMCAAMPFKDCQGFSYEGTSGAAKDVYFKSEMASLKEEEGWTTYERELTILEKALTNVDADGNGELDCDELHVFFTEIAKAVGDDPPSREFVDEVLAKHDIQVKDGRLNEEEFHQILKIAVAQIYLYNEAGAKGSKDLFLDPKGKNHGKKKKSGDGGG